MGSARDAWAHLSIDGRRSADPIAYIIDDYRALVTEQCDGLVARDIDVGPYALSHFAVRVPEWDQYLHLRTLLERHATANRESVWNGRPISILLLTEPLEVFDRCRLNLARRRAPFDTIGARGP